MQDNAISPIWPQPATEYMFGPIIYGMVFSSLYIVLFLSVVRREAGEYTCISCFIQEAQKEN